MFDCLLSFVNSKHAKFTWKESLSLAQGRRKKAWKHSLIDLMITEVVQIGIVNWKAGLKTHFLWQTDRHSGSAEWFKFSWDIFIWWKYVIYPSAWNRVKVVAKRYLEQIPIVPICSTGLRIQQHMGELWNTDNLFLWWMFNASSRRLYWLVVFSWLKTITKMHQNLIFYQLSK